MAIVRRKISDEELRQALDEMERHPMPSEEEIERHAIEDDSVMPDDFGWAGTWVYPPLGGDRIVAMRTRLGLSQTQFAQRYGFSPHAIDQYERHERTATGAEANVLRMVEADPDFVARVLEASVRGRETAAPAEVAAAK